MRGTLDPDRAIMGVPNLDPLRATALAEKAVQVARRYMPKVTAASANSLYPISGDGWFGVAWASPHVWFQEAGIRPFTMRSLAGKTIPMWVNDPDGKEAAKQKRPKIRRTVDGRMQTLIFRRAAQIGQKKMVWRMEAGQMVRRSVPASYPGAPGRIAVNRSRGLLRQGDTNPGVGNPGWISPGNVGVRWRHPGLNPGQFVARGVFEVAALDGLPLADIQYLNEWVHVGSAYTVLLTRG